MGKGEQINEQTDDVNNSHADISKDMDENASDRPLENEVAGEINNVVDNDNVKDEGEKHDVEKDKIQENVGSNNDNNVSGPVVSKETTEMDVMDLETEDTGSRNQQSTESA